MKEPKFFIKIEKAFQDQGNWFVQGIASGTLEDRDEEKMNKTVLEKFARSIPLPLTDNHPSDGNVLAELGQVVDAKIMDDEANSLFIKAQLDYDHPAVPYMVKQIQKGKRYAFSIEGLKPMTSQVWSDKLKKMITEYVDVVPKAISITTEPSYTPSFMEVVQKSINYNLEDNMKKTKTETEEVKVEEVKTETPEVTEEVKTEEVETPEVTKEEVKTEPEPTQPDVVEVDKTAKTEESVKKQLDVEEITEAVQEAEEEKAEEEAEDAEDQREYEILMGLCMKVDQLSQIVNALVESDQAVHSMMDETVKSVESTDKLLKSFHNEIEVLKDLPLQKRSRVVSKSFEERKEEDNTPKTTRDIVKNLI